MVDGDDDERDDDRGDRILVRPYVLPDDPDEDVEQTASITSRDIASLTIDGDVPTEILPSTGRAPAPPADANDRTMVLWLVGAGLAVVVAAAVVMIALWPRNDSGPQQGSSGPPVMPVGAGVSVEPSRDAASATASASPSVSPSASATRSPTRPAASPRRPGAPAPSVEIAMAAGRTGPVANDSGLCLDAGTLGLAINGVLAPPCSGSAAQRWTVGGDRTLRIGGLCAAADGGSVRTVACNGGENKQQWQAGPDGSVVNVGSHQCLTDPRGAKGVARVRLAPCQDDGQHWSLP